jgi:prevent-host-death family protein
VIGSKITFPFQTVSLSDARKKLSEIIERVHNGERIGITRRGKLAAVIIPPHSKTSLKRIFRDIEEIRQHARPHKAMCGKDLIQEGRF